VAPGIRPTAAAVVVGSELLSGKIEDRNTPYLARALRRVGVLLRKVSMVPDEAASIEAALREALEIADHVFTSGGIGPTHDDITPSCVARVLGQPIVRHPEMVRLLRALIGDRITEVHLRMADLPGGTELLFANEQVVPAMKAGQIYLLPGIPEIFQEKVDQIMPTLGGVPFFLASVLLRIGEGSLAPHLEAVLVAYPGVSIGSYPELGAGQHFQVKVTLEADEAATVNGALEALIARLTPDRILSRSGVLRG